MFNTLHSQIQLYLSCDDSLEIDRLNEDIYEAYCDGSISPRDYDYLIRLIG